MRKTDKKIDNALRVSLTQVCEEALKQIEGFQWLTHLVNYSNFPKSLKLVCVFASNESLAAFMQSKHQQSLESMLHQELCAIGINLKNFKSHVAYDTEERCEQQNGGNWAARLGS